MSALPCMAGSARLPPLVPAGPCEMHREFQNQGWSPFFLTSGVRSWCLERLSEPREGLNPSSSGPSEDRPASSQTGQTSTQETLISLLSGRGGPRRAWTAVIQTLDKRTVKIFILRSQVSPSFKIPFKQEVPADGTHHSADDF